MSKSTRNSGKKRGGVLHVITCKFAYINRRRTDFLARRPHRSFKLTRRRDYIRSLALPGYFSFTSEVVKTLRKRTRTYLTLAVLFALFNAVLVGVSSQESYRTLADAISEAGSQITGGGFGNLGEAGLLLGGAIAGTFAPQLSDVQQVYAVLLGVLVWLATVWLLRAQSNGATPSLRDALYSSGSPLVPTVLLFIVGLLQLVPFALSVIGINIANQTGLLEGGGVLSMLAWLVATLFGIASIYWVTNTVIAMVVITLPGIRPMEAIRTSGDLIIGRRLRIMYRLLWLGLVIIITWILTVLPAIFIDRWVVATFNISWLPLVPIAITIVASLSTVFAAAYVYILYRKVVDDDASPA